MTRRPIGMVSVGVVGLVATVMVAIAVQMPASDAATLVLFAGVGAAVAGLAAAALLHALRRASVGLQVIIATLAPVLAITIGVAVASADMFISTHDLHALFVVLTAAGTIGIVESLVLGRRIADAGRSLGEMARAFADAGPGSRFGTAETSASPAELASLALELDTMSARLAEAQDQASAVERSRRELVAWVSHDLRTPLAGIRAMVEALEDGVVDDAETVARYHRTIRKEADRLAGLVDDLFELSRIEAGAIGLDLERVPLDELVSEALAGVSMAAGAKGIDLLGSVSEPSPIVELSTPEMGRVVRNLLDNAIRHTPAGGTIRVEAGVDPEFGLAVVSILDACGGIPERDLDHVFELAYRGDAARTPGDGGAGFGLAVAKGLVEAHRGEITVHNEGDGCRFTVRMPVCGVAT